MCPPPTHMAMRHNDTLTIHRCGDIVNTSRLLFPVYLAVNQWSVLRQGGKVVTAAEHVKGLTIRYPGDDCDQQQELIKTIVDDLW